MGRAAEASGAPQAYRTNACNENESTGGSDMQSSTTTTEVNETSPQPRRPMRAVIIGVVILAAAGWAGITMSQNDVFVGEREVEAIVGLRETPDDSSSEIVVLVWNSCESGVEATVTVVETPDQIEVTGQFPCLLYTSPSPRDRTRSRMPSSA